LLVSLPKTLNPTESGSTEKESGLQASVLPHPKCDTVDNLQTIQLVILTCFANFDESSKK